MVLPIFLDEELSRGPGSSPAEDTVVASELDRSASAREAQLWSLDGVVLQGMFVTLSLSSGGLSKARPSVS